MADLGVPKLNNNDSEYTLTEWLVPDGHPVRDGDPVATIETSKAAEELPSTADGILHHLTPAGAECTPGEVIARILAPGTAPTPETPADTTTNGPVITAPAQALLKELGIDPARVRTLGRKVIRRADVEALVAEGVPGGGDVPPPAERDAPTREAAPGGGVAPGEVVARGGAAAGEVPGGVAGDVYGLSDVQRAVGRAVARSHATIPAAYTVIKVDVRAALAAARAESRRLRRLVGLPDLLVAVVAKLHGEFPLFFAELLDERTARLADAPRVAVSVDLGEGLYLPVVREHTVEKIAETLARFRTSAQRRDFRAEDLAGANITVTLHHEEGIVLAIPVVPPGQACALALGAPEDGFAHVGLAYDHRLVNGRDAVLFLKALAAQLDEASRL